MSYKGKYTIKNKSKYAGDSNKVVYRSLWERRLMVYCDKQKSVVEWGSEEIVIPYYSPLDGKMHRYYPDFYMTVRQKDGSIKKFIVEVKPKKDMKQPPANPKKRTKAWLKSVRTYAMNKTKFKYAEDFCKDKNLEFLILNEDHLAPKYK